MEKGGPEPIIMNFGFGRRTVEINVPETLQIDTVSYRESVADQNVLQQALRQPIESRSLRELAVGKKNAVILISDQTRLCPSYLFLPLLVQELNLVGIPDHSIRIIVSLGLHRKQTQQELEQLVGTQIYKRIQVLNHSARSEDCVLLGTTRLGTPIEINQYVVNADLRIATGNIEPHRLVGMSGGVKALVPGVASHRCIEHNHGLSQRFQVTPGDVENPIHQDLEEALHFLTIDFVYNVIVNHQKEVMAAVAGHVVAAHRQGVQLAKQLFTIDVSSPYDLVVASTGGFPKDMQLYQAVKTLQNASAVTKKGGTILLIAQCEEIFGNGIFQYWTEVIQDQQVISKMLQEQFVIGAHKLEHIHKVRQQHTVYLHSNVPPPLVELLGFIPVSHLQETFDSLASKPNIRIAFMPYGALTFAQTTF